MTTSLGFIDQAPCGNADVGAFFPADAEQGIPHRAQDAARHYCRSCPVKNACYQAAVDGDEIGLWGGYWHSRNQERVHKVTDLLEHRQLRRTVVLAA